MPVQNRMISVLRHWRWDGRTMQVTQDSDYQFHLLGTILEQEVDSRIEIHSKRDVGGPYQLAKTDMQAASVSSQHSQPSLTASEAATLKDRPRDPAPFAADLMPDTMPRKQS